MIRRIAKTFADHPWMWSYLLAAALWGGILIMSGGVGGTAILTAALQFATFYVIVGIGQMLVVSAGPGNIDLTFPGIIALAGYLSMGVMGGSDAGLLPGLLVGIGIGVGAGLANVVIIRALRIPPMIGTLACGFVLQSVAIAYSGTGAATPAPQLLDFVTSRVLGVPLLALVFIAAAVAVSLVYRRTTFGHAVLAVGQSPRAARLTGISVGRTIGIVYILSGALAGLAGTLLAAYSGGASLEMGADFTLGSIAIVVLGGTAISGGQVAPLGLWGAAVVLQLLATLLNVMAVSNGSRFVLTGIIILAVLSFTTRRKPS